MSCESWMYPARIRSPVRTNHSAHINMRPKTPCVRNKTNLLHVYYIRSKLSGHPILSMDETNQNFIRKSTMLRARIHKKTHRHLHMQRMHHACIHAQIQHHIFIPKSLTTLHKLPTLRRHASISSAFAATPFPTSAWSSLRGTAVMPFKRLTDDLRSLMSRSYIQTDEEESERKRR